MARVPTYEGPQVAPQPVQSAQFSGRVPQYPGGASQDLSAGLQNFAEGMKRVQQQRDVDMVLQAETALQTADQQFSLDASQRLGQRAFGLSTEAAKWWDDKVREIDGSLENDDQRIAFRKRADQRRMVSLGQVSRHEALENRKSAIESMVANNQAAIQSIVGAPKDADVYKLNRGNIDRNLEAVAQMNGWTPGIKAQKALETTTLLHGQVIASLAEGEDIHGAKAHYYTNKKEIDPKKWVTIESLLDKAGKDAEVLGYTIKAVKHGDEIEAMRWIDENVKPDLVREVRAATKERYVEHKAALDRARVQYADQAQDELNRGASWFRISKRYLDKLDPDVYKAMEKEAQARANGENIVTDWGLYYDLRQMAMREPEKFANTDLRKHFGDIGRDKREQLIDLQSSIRKGDAAKNREVATLQQQLSVAHNEMGLSDRDRERKGQFDSVVIDDVDDAVKAKGRPLTYDETQAIIKRNAQEVLTPGRVWGTSSMPAYQAKKQGREVKGLDIDSADRRAIEVRFKARGITPTNEQIEAAYKAWKGL